MPRRRRASARTRCPTAAPSTEFARSRSSWSSAFTAPCLNTFPFNRGWIGVDVFFVLSGYLITTLLLREKAKRGTVSLKHFYLRRALRILPALYAWIAVLWLTKTVSAPVVLLVVLYVANIAMATGRLGDGPAAHSWSLCIEEQFYAFWPWLVRSVARRRLLFLTLGACAGIALWRIALVRMGVSLFPGIYMRPDTRMDVPLWGCAAAMIEQEDGFAGVCRSLRPYSRPILGALLALGLLSFRLSWKWGGSIDYTTRFGFTANAAIVAALILWIRGYPDSLPVRLLGTRAARVGGPPLVQHLPVAPRRVPGRRARVEGAPRFFARADPAGVRCRRPGGEPRHLARSDRPRPRAVVLFDREAVSPPEGEIRKSRSFPRSPTSGLGGGTMKSSARRFSQRS